MKSQMQQKHICHPSSSPVEKPQGGGQKRCSLIWKQKGKSPAQTPNPLRFTGPRRSALFEHTVRHVDLCDLSRQFLSKLQIHETLFDPLLHNHELWIFQSTFMGHEPCFAFYRWGAGHLKNIGFVVHQNIR